jgi:hypothetical protein
VCAAILSDVCTCLNILSQWGHCSSWLRLSTLAGPFVPPPPPDLIQHLVLIVYKHDSLGIRSKDNRLDLTGEVDKESRKWHARNSHEKTLFLFFFSSRSLTPPIRVPPQMILPLGTPSLYFSWQNNLGAIF